MRVPILTRTLVLATAALVAAMPMARADVIYNFTFTAGSGGRLDGQGTFSTGVVSGQDPGYFVLTGLNFTAVRDGFAGSPGPLNTGNLIQTTFGTGSAYNPVTQGFINHLYGGTTDNYGGGDLIGSTSPNDFGSSQSNSLSFSQGGSVNLYSIAGQNFNASYLDLLNIASPTSPTTVPEPPSFALLGTVVAGLGLLRRGNRPKPRHAFESDEDLRE